MGAITTRRHGLKTKLANPLHETALYKSDALVLTSHSGNTKLAREQGLLEAWHLQDVAENRLRVHRIYKRGANII
jgi:hypothetical protein